jgi:hypothetical protein
VSRDRPGHYPAITPSPAGQDPCFPDIWDVDRTKELWDRTWWWWWWLFLLKDQDHPGRTRQLMILWATRNCRDANINGMQWRNRIGIRHSRLEPEGPAGEGERRVDFSGVTACWYFDGERMVEPLILAGGEGRSSHFFPGSGRHHGRVGLDADGIRTAFEGWPDRAEIAAVGEHRGRKITFHFTATPWTAPLWEIQPTGKDYFMQMGYAMRKYRGARVKGRIDVSGAWSGDVEGTAYFQKVRIASPTSPWYWAVFHSADGSYFDYFMPHIGLPALRRGIGHRSGLDRGERILSKGFHMWHGPSAREIVVKKIKMKKQWNGDLPIFILTGEEPGRSLRAVMETYARATWRVQQPFLPFLPTRLHYNEYPAFMREFELREGGERITLDDLGYNAGNCEHAWGIV